MALSETFRIIWLDAFIGQDKECQSFKRMFCSTLEPGAKYDDPLDRLICALEENAAPFTFVDTTDKALQKIRFYSDKRIIFITSGSLGQHIIPGIASTYSQVYSYYIFCAIIKNYLEFALDYRECLQVFISELDLLVRLVRDVSLEIINKGRGHLELNDPKPALEHFEHSKALETTANQTDKLNSPFYDHLRLLDGYRDDIGLIQRARNMIAEQDQESMNDTAAEPFVAESIAEVHEELELQYQGSLSEQPETEYRDQGSPIAQQIYQEDEE